MEPSYNLLVCGSRAAMFATVQQTPMTALPALKLPLPGSIHVQ
jgi:hypothetical protein